MDTNNLIAQASKTIAAPVAAVWEALTNPALIKQYMFGTDVVSDWREGSTAITAHCRGCPTSRRITILSRSRWLARAL